jgi:hypothetical protein
MRAALSITSDGRPNRLFGFERVEDPRRGTGTLQVCAPLSISKVALALSSRHARDSPSLTPGAFA